MKENDALINLEAIMVLPDIMTMYPSTHAAEAVEKVGDKIRHLCQLSVHCPLSFNFVNSF